MDNDQRNPPKLVSEPRQIINDIPVFSPIDFYVKNYMQIASDHVAAIKPNLDNPFIENNLWVQLEDSTRSLIDKYVSKGSFILDAGVGLGRLLSPMSQLNRYGIDISFDYLNKAREVGINVAFSRIEDLPYEDESFDAVVACDVLEHVLDLNFCTKNLLRVLKKGGYLIIRVPYKEDLSPYLKEDYPYEYVHLRSFDENSLILFFAKVLGCKVLELSTVAPYQAVAKSCFRLFSPADDGDEHDPAATFFDHHDDGQIGN